MTSFDSAFRNDVIPSTGGYIEVSSEVKRKVSALTRNASNMWIGIASQGESGMRGRWNSKYKSLGLKYMAKIYQTTSDSFRKNLEDELVNFYGSNLDNLNAGGGGGFGSSPYVVYVAWK